MNRLKRYLRSNKFFDAIIIGVLLIFLIVELYPIWYVLAASVSDPEAVKAGDLMFLPIGFSFQGYEMVMQYKDIWTGYGNTILYTVLGTMLNLAVTLPCAYAFSRKDMVGRKLLMVIFMITMYIGGGLIPGYLNVKSFGLLNNRAWMILNGAISVYNMIVSRTFFASSIPYELTEAARIDGCSDIGIFSEIVLPLSKALVAVMTLYYGVGHWNSYFDAMIYLKERQKFPLQLVLMEILTQSQFAQSAIIDGSATAEEFALLNEMAKSADMLKYCIIVVATLPMMILYPRLQKFFEKGVMIGSVKG